MVHRLVLSMQQKVFYQINGCYYKTRKIIGNQRQTATHSPTSHKCSRVRRKLQTIRETTLAMRGNIKPFKKRLSPCAETSNLLRNELRKARKGYKQKKHSEEMNLQSALIKGGGYLLSRIALQYHRRKWA